MATAICRVPIVRNGVHSMATQPNDKQLRPELVKIVEDIIGLRQLATTTGFMTFKEQRIILERLSAEDKAAVGRALAKIEQQKK